MAIEIVLLKTFGGLSIFGGCFTILSYFIFPYNSPSQTYALWLAISAIGYGMVPFLSFLDDSNYLCKFTGFIDNYFYLTALFTTAVIANCMRQIFLYDPSSCNTRESLKLAIQPKNYLFVWIFPFFLNLLPLLTNHFGRIENGGIHSCWIKTDTNDIRRNHLGLIWVGVTMYIPLLICFIFNVYVYVSIWQKVKQWKIISPQISLKLGLAVNRIAWYPLILIVVWIFPVISHYGQYFGYSPAWLPIAASSVRLQGFLDAIAYGLTEGLIHRWSKVVKSCFWCQSQCRASEQHTPSDDTSSFRPAISNRSHDSSSIIFSEGYLWDRLVPDVPGSTYSSSISESGYYTPLTSHDIAIPSRDRDRDFLRNPLDTKIFPYK